MGIKNLIAGVIVLSWPCMAQNDTIENTYYKSFKNNLAVQVFTLNTSNFFSINYTRDNITVDVEPNKKTTLGIAVQYDIITFSVGYAPKFFADNRDNKDSKMTSFSFNFFPSRFIQHLDFYYQKGMSLESSDATIYMPNLKSVKFGGTTSYLFNKNFSCRATAFQNEKQLKSAGSFAPGISYYYTELNGEKEEQLGDKVYFIDVAICPAYYYNWVIAKDFLVSAGGSLGAGFTTIVDDRSITSLLLAGSLHLAQGYSGERFFCGVNARVNFFAHQAESNVDMNDAISYTTIFAGYRFDPPGFLEKEKQKLENKISKNL